jgi:hypothetical protein
VAQDLEGFDTEWNVPGASVAVSKSLGAQIAGGLLPELVLPTVHAAVRPSEALQDCDTPIRYGIRLHGLAAAGGNVYEDALWDLLDTGVADVYANCGGIGTQFVDIAGYSRAGGSFVYIQLQNVKLDDLTATMRLLTTLQLDYASVPAPSTGQTQPDLVTP